MQPLFAIVLKIFSLLPLSQRDLMKRLLIAEKELEILRRHVSHKRILPSINEKAFLGFLCKIFPTLKNRLQLFTPETVLRWYRAYVRRMWTYPSNRRRGRPPVDAATKELVRSMKNDNLTWGAKKISGELNKLGVELSPKTIRLIIRELRRDGKIAKSLSWRKFLTMHMDSIYAMDFLTVDSILGSRFYVHFVIAHKTREIIQFAITKNPVREFVRQQIIELENSMQKTIYIIHDNASQFNFDYLAYSMKKVCTSVEAPNMNAIAERFVGTLRRECLDWHIIINEAQLKRILTEYVGYYNSKRPHQGLRQCIPKGYDPQKRGVIMSEPILGGLHHHYYRKVA